LAASAGLVPEPALCPGADAAERPQEMLYMGFYFNFFANLKKIRMHLIATLKHLPL
jgi:hypothetical protein